MCFHYNTRFGKNQHNFIKLTIISNFTSKNKSQPAECGQSLPIRPSKAPFSRSVLEKTFSCRFSFNISPVISHLPNAFSAKSKAFGQKGSRPQNCGRLLVVLFFLRLCIKKRGRRFFRPPRFGGIYRAFFLIYYNVR